jgi:aryl-alcohol dehydrogenase-like predicted oxidoreductase
MVDMEYRNLGRSGLVVSEVSLGSWLTLGSSVDRAATREIVHRAFDLGVNLFDTADVYSNGAGEEALGAALQDIPRRYVVIATKCFFPMSERPNDRGLSRKHIVESVEGSLRRLGTDYVDLLQCHRYDPEHARRGDGARVRRPRASGQAALLGRIGMAGRADRRRVPLRGCDPRRASDLEPAAVQPAPARHRARRDSVSRREGLSQIVWSPLAQGALTASTAAASAPPARARPTACATCS